jgi:hypothetical protein
MRRAQSLRAATYRCPFCDGLLHASSEHVLIAPEDDRSRRRHAHVDCVLAERRAGRLPTLDEWRASSGARGPGGGLRGWLSRRRRA